MDYSNRNQNDRYNDLNERGQYRRDNDENYGQSFGSRGNYDSRSQYENYNQSRNRKEDLGGYYEDQNRNWRDEDSGRSSFNRGYEGNYGGRQFGSGSQGYGGERYQGSGYGSRGYYDSSRDRGYGSGYERGGQNYGGSGWQEDRNWFDRTKDEVSSWFGDDDAERRRRMDKMREGQHRGKGPKGYRRSDERIKEDINDRLSDDPYVDASDIDVTVSSGEVTLTGTVEDRNTKRRAEDIAEAVSGVSHVQNNLRVGQRSGSSTGYGNLSSGSATSATGSATTGSSSMSATSGNDQRKEKVR